MARRLFLIINVAIVQAWALRSKSIWIAMSVGVARRQTSVKAGIQSLKCSKLALTTWL